MPQSQLSLFLYFCLVTPSTSLCGFLEFILCYVSATCKRDNIGTSFFLPQVLLQSLGFEGLEWDTSGEKNELVLYRKDHSLKLLLQSKKVRNCQPVSFISALYDLHGRRIHV